MAEQVINIKRLLLPLEEQVAFLDSVHTKSNLSWAEIARRVGVHPRRMSDWKIGDGTIPLSVAEALSTLSGIAMPASGKIVEQYWNNSAAAAKAGAVTYAKYGNVGGDPDYRKEQWRKWWNGYSGKNNLGSRAIQKKIHHALFSEDLAELLGVILGDGGITNRQVTVTLDSETDKEYIPHIARLFEKLFGVIPTMYNSAKFRAVTLTISRTALVNYLCEIGLEVGNKVRHQVDIPTWIKKNKDFSRACVRGLVDTDGCIFIERHLIRGKTYDYPRISFVNHSMPLLKSVQKILIDEGFEARLRSNRAVTLEKPADVIRYFSCVGSHNPKHVRRFNDYQGACVSGRNRQS